MKELNTVDENSMQKYDRLIVRNISKNFPGVKALDRISLTVRRGEVHALLGENGAGKSTLSSIIAGLIQPDEGDMIWENDVYKPKTPGDAILSQIGFIHQELKLVPQLSVAENIFLGRIPTKRGKGIDRNFMEKESHRQLEKLGLVFDTKKKVKELSVAEQQMVEIAKALTLNANLLILDEPTAALGSKETIKLFEIIEQLKKRGVSFIYITHRLEEVEKIADRITVLRDGQRIQTHDSADIQINKLVEEMVGRKVNTIFPEISSPENEEEVLTVKNLTSFDGSFRDVNFSVKKGEIFGIAGVVGAGRTEIIRAIAGVDQKASGEIYVNGKPIRIKQPLDSIKAGIVMVPEDRKHQGLIIDQTISDNLSLSKLDLLINRRGWIFPKKIIKNANNCIKEFGIKGSPKKLLKQLSGGNQQKVLISKWVSRDPQVLILDEPTRGVDVGARNAIYSIIKNLSEKGLSIIIISSELDEVIGLSHRVMVLSRGIQRGILEKSEITNVNIMHLATT